VVEPYPVCKKKREKNLHNWFLTVTVADKPPKPSLNTPLVEIENAKFHSTKLVA
jgi:hypothetical protein